MKRIIDNKVYDTCTARSIGSASHADVDRLYGWSEELFIKRTGEYFLYGEGGPGSKYGRQTDTNNWSGGETIKPLTYAEARVWAEKNLDADAYLAHFEPAHDDDARSVLSISVSAAAADAARKAAVQAGITLSAYIEQLIIRG